MNKLLWVVLACVVAAGCKTKKTVFKASSNMQKSAMADNSPRDLIFKTDSSDLDFKTFNARGRAEVNLEGHTNAASVNVRIKKNEIIWININLGFISVATAYITPDSVKILNKIQGGSIRKSFAYLQQYTSPMLDFKALQSLLVGNKLSGFILPGAVLKPDSNGFAVKSSNDSLIAQLNFNRLFKAAAASLKSTSGQKNVSVVYDDFTTIDQKNLPTTVNISSVIRNKSYRLLLNYKKITLNENLDFPYN